MNSKKPIHILEYIIRNTGILTGMYPFFPELELYKVNILHKEIK